MEPYGPVAGSGNLVVLQIQELIGWHIVGHDIAAVCFHHHWEDEAVENNIVFTDKMYQTGFVVLPPFLPGSPTLRIALAELLRVGNITDRRIKPNIEHLAFSSFYRNGNTPIKITRHGTWLQVHIQPALALAVNIRTPLLMAFQNPLFQPFLILVQRQIPVLGFLQHWLRAADGTLRIDELCR